MILNRFSYKEYEGSSRYWELKEFQLGNVNLIVGNNASGKSRTLNVIFGLARIILSPKLLFNSGSYSACFKDGESEIRYFVEFDKGSIMNESLMQDKEVLFSRNSDGHGEISNIDLKMKIKFKIPNNELVINRRDEIQFPFLENLFKWASNTRHFRFAKEEEKKTLVLIDSNKPKTESFNLDEANQAIEIFRKAKTKYKEQYVSKVIEDLKKIGYDVSNITIGVLQSITVDSPIGNKVVGLRVSENDRKGITDQNEMSDGMFRALSILIHYNYYELEGKNLNVLIDDIGEGLDFERSSNLIKLLIEKSIRTGIQLTMSTNDKFVMNNTNLDYWQVISREGGVVSMFNKHNSEKIFKEFKFTGLNNFDFFTTDFFKTGLR